MELITILGICATFFSIVILLVHFSIIGVNWYKTNSKKQKESDIKKMRELLEQIRKEEDSAVAHTLNTTH